MADFDQDAFDRWLKANSPGGEEREPPDPGLRFLASMMQGTPVVINGTLTGASAQQALELDAAYSSAPAGQPAIDALADSPTTGAAMMLTLAQEQSGYNPGDPAQTGSVAKFMDYVNQVILCPLYSTIINDHVTPGFSGDWNRVIDQIIGYYIGIPARDLDTLRQSLVTIAAAASSNPSTNQVLNMFSQATLSVSISENIPTIDTYMYHMNVQMKTTVHSGGKNEPDRVSNQGNMTLYRLQFRFDALQWAAQAAAVYETTQQSLSDWLAEGSTPSGDLPDNWAPR